MRHVIFISHAQAAERLALPAAGGLGFSSETEKNQSHEKCHFGGVIPAVLVHALLGALYQDDAHGATIQPSGSMPSPIRAA
jgi:hypothetical protein